MENAVDLQPLQQAMLAQQWRQAQLSGHPPAPPSRSQWQQRPQSGHMAAAHSNLDMGTPSASTFSRSLPQYSLQPQLSRDADTNLSDFDHTPSFNVVHQPESGYDLLANSNHPLGSRVEDAPQQNGYQASSQSPRGQLHSQQYTAQRRQTALRNGDFVDNPQTATQTNGHAQARATPNPQVSSQPLQNGSAENGISNTTSRAEESSVLGRSPVSTPTPTPTTSAQPQMSMNGLSHDRFQPQAPGSISSPARSMSPAVVMPASYAAYVQYGYQQPGTSSPAQQPGFIQTAGNNPFSTEGDQQHGGSGRGGQQDRHQG